MTISNANVSYLCINVIYLKKRIQLEAGHEFYFIFINVSTNSFQIAVRIPLGFFGQLLRDVSTDEHSFKINPEILNKQPPFKDFVGIGQVTHPLLDLLSERGVVPESKKLY